MVSYEGTYVIIQSGAQHCCVDCHGWCCSLFKIVGNGCCSTGGLGTGVIAGAEFDSDTGSGAFSSG